MAQKYFYMKTDKAPDSYRSGEEATFDIYLREDGKPASCHSLKWEIKADFGYESAGEESGESGHITLRAKLERPGFIYVRAWACGNDGEKLPECDELYGGAGYEPEKIAGVTEKPCGYDDFWQSCRTELHAVPPQEIEKRKLTDDPEHPNHDIYDMRLACAGGIPVSGILTVPRDGKKHACRAVFQGYGVKSAWFNFSDDEVIFCVNAHGIPNAMPDEYYAELADGRLRGYGFDREQNKNPHTCYFKYMMIRAAQALRYLMTLPEWDGKNLISRGGSQGAVQAMHAAYLVPEVNLLDIFVPWLCDINAASIGRLCGWGELGGAIRFFDLTLRAPYIKMKTVIRAGLGDYTTPPAGVCAMYNALGAKEKNLTLVQCKEHIYESPEAEEFTVDF